MQIVRNSKTIRAVLAKAKAKGKTIGFVPTMGALHAGHLSLIRKCKKENDITVISIFVNPAQFGPREDYTSYPRDKKKDVLLAKKENVDIIFYPSEKNLYPKRYLTFIHVAELTNVLCGKSRPGHFKGAATIVGKLLNIIAPNTLYLGQKDFQQCVVIRQMVRDLDFSVKIKILPTVREPDGLALSSRNKYLSVQQRKEAVVLYQALCSGKEKILDGEQSAAKIIRRIQSIIRKQSSGKIDYIACVDAQTLQTIPRLKGKICIALAVCFGQSRLIDNVLVQTNKR